MIQPLAVLLDSVERWLPPELVGLRERDLLRRRAGGVPGAWTAGCVECRLTAGRNPCDLFAYATRDGGALPVLRRALRTRVGAAFGGARPFLAEWTRPGSLLARQMPMLWLEFDLPLDRAAPDPFPFICLYPDYLKGEEPRHDVVKPLPPKRMRAIAATGLRLALGRPASEQQLDLVERCAGKLPFGGRLFHVVGMPQRPTRDLRVGAILPSTALKKWLQDIGWSGRAHQFRELQELTASGAAFIHAQVELGEGVRPKLALDFQLESIPGVTKGWDRFVNRLAGTGICDERKARAALRWMRSRPVRLPGQVAPARMNYRLFFKVTSAPEGMEAKAYLGFQPGYELI